MGRRLFVSVDLDALAADVERVQEPLRVDGLRPTDPADAHVTVKFLGDTDPGRVGALTEALEAAAAEADVGPFEVSLSGYGVFPAIEYISVVYLGVDDGAAALTRLHEAVEARTTALGFDPADHEFTPHVTLARMDHAANKEHVQELVRERDPGAGRTRVTELRLTESTLTDEGPEYETVAAVEL